MKHEIKMRPALLATGVMMALVLAPVKAAIHDGLPKATRISTVELAANPERFVGKDVMVKARVEKAFGEHWFAIDEGEVIPGPSVLVLVTTPVRAASAGEKIIVAGYVRRFSRSELEKEYGRCGLQAPMEPQFQNRPLIVADSILSPNGEEMVAPPEPEEKLTPEQKKAKDVHRVRALIPATKAWPKPLMVSNRAADESEPKTPAQISPEAQTMLDQMRNAYQNLETAELNGQIQADVEMSGQKQKMQHQFTSSYQAPNKFRHQLEDGLLIGSTGQKTYIFQKSANAFFQQKAPDGRVPIEELPSPIPQLLQTQNPSLLFAIIKDPVRGVTAHMKEINKIENVKIQGQSYPAIALIPQDGQSKITILMDPQSHLLKRLDIEISPDMLKNGKTENGLQGVKAQIEYTSIKTQPKFDQDHFTWAPPEGAKDLATEKQRASAKSLIGKPAPDFTLESVDGESISLSDLKGQVVVLDFWATWCPPCVKSLPELEQIHQQKAGDSVKVFAINLKESPQQIRSFLQSRGLSLPVLLDTDGEVAQKFNVNAIPQTIIIGKDGQITKVFVGASTDTPDQIRAEIEMATGEQQARYHD